MTSPLSGATLTAQRASNRWKTYHLAISHPNTIFTALVNGTPDDLDGVISVTYDNGTGTYGDVKPGMAYWISASAYGAFDVGIVRVRAALTATTAPIGKVSNIAITDNYFLTFVDDFPLVTKEPYVVDTTIFMDETVEFGAASSFAPIVKIGPPALVLELTGATVAHTRPAPTIYSPTGATAASRSRALASQ